MQTRVSTSTPTVAGVSALSPKPCPWRPKLRLVGDESRQLTDAGASVSSYSSTLRELRGLSKPFLCFANTSPSRTHHTHAMLSQGKEASRSTDTGSRREGSLKGSAPIGLRADTEYVAGAKHAMTRTKCSSTMDLFLAKQMRLSAILPKPSIAEHRR